MSSLTVAYRTPLRVRQVLPRLLAALLCFAALAGAATPARANAQRPVEFIRWPANLAPRAPALARAIENEAGERLWMIVFTGPDSMEVMFWNPSIWSNDLHSKEIPKETLPTIREAQLHLAKYVWSTFARDAGINYLSISFERVLREDHLGVAGEFPHGQVGIHINRQQFELGKPELGLTTVTQW